MNLAARARSTHCRFWRAWGRTGQWLEQVETWRMVMASTGHGGSGGLGVWWCDAGVV